MRQRFSVRVFSGALWAYLVWNLLTWTATLENLLVGAGVSLAVALAIAATGTIVPPWHLLDPRRLWGMLRLVAAVLGGIARENVLLARRIWAPSRPISSGMIVTGTGMDSDGEIATVALATSLIVNTQFIDLDRSRKLFQFHALDLPSSRRRINDPIERRVTAISRR